MPDHGLNPRQLDILRGILSPFADSIERVGLFGSRATGKMRPDSDVDMVIYGPISEGDIDRLRSLFDASLLAIKVDIIAYERIAYPALKAHIDAVMRVLFMRGDLGSRLNLTRSRQ